MRPNHSYENFTETRSAQIRKNQGILTVLFPEGFSREHSMRPFEEIAKNAGEPLQIVATFDKKETFYSLFYVDGKQREVRTVVQDPTKEQPANTKDIKIYQYAVHGTAPFVWYIDFGRDSALNSDQKQERLAALSAKMGIEIKDGSGQFDAPVPKRKIRSRKPAAAQGSQPSA